jgi:hypothetical protein
VKVASARFAETLEISPDFRGVLVPKLKARPQTAGAEACGPEHNFVKRFPCFARLSLMHLARAFVLVARSMEVKVIKWLATGPRR